VAGAVATRDEAEPEPAVASPPQTLQVSGAIASAGDFELIPLAASAPGDEWRISPALIWDNRPFIVCLFDADYELVQRQYVSAGAPLEHIARAGSETMYLGVAAAGGSSGGAFRFDVRRRGGRPIPAPAPQAVWLNFAGTRSLSVRNRAPIAFGAFAGKMAGSKYVSHTDVLKEEIVATFRAEYADYNVLVFTSDDGPPPFEPCAEVHFGSWDERLLGLADSIDQYNLDPAQVAVVYVESFADFAGMGLDASEMGQMIGNVAAHEFGHLLGLFHTRRPTDLMDTTGTARDLAREQEFSRAPLEASVFPFGYENSPDRLAETVGRTPKSAATALANTEDAPTMLRKAVVRSLAREQLRGRCGTCLHLDE
jgi:hypothetical protein